MPDPGSSLRAMLASQDKFDLKRVRVLCMAVTADMIDPVQAQHWQQRVVDTFATVEVALGFDALGFSGTNPRQLAIELVAEMESAARG